jgi:uncharacterized protein
MTNDAHCHFLSSRFFEVLGAEKYGAPVPATSVAEELGWEAPGEPERLAQRWATELENNGVARAALIASVHGDEASVAVAVQRFPERFVGFFVLNPTAPGALERAQSAFQDLAMRCVCLFPALHQYRLDDERASEVFKLAAMHNAAVFAHCGYLSIEARVRLGLPGVLDLRCGDPLALARTAGRYRGVPVIIPHFGAGFFREALMAAEAAPNIYLDTSSSNGWIKYFPGLTLTDVFRQALAVVGPERLLFGSDSSFFPRGWRGAILDAQRAALDALGVDADSQAQIFGRNFERVFSGLEGSKV